MIPLKSFLFFNQAIAWIEGQPAPWRDRLLIFSELGVGRFTVYDPG